MWMKTVCMKNLELVSCNIRRKFYTLDENTVEKKNSMNIKILRLYLVLNDNNFYHKSQV